MKNKIVHLRIATYYLLLLTFLIAPQTPKAQEWSEPVTIFSGGKNFSQDFAIDSKGYLHVVWEHWFTDMFRKIYYSKSTDGGNTWTAPYDLAQNSDYCLHQCRIVAGLGDTLYVSYSHMISYEGNTNVHLQVFDGTAWSTPMNVTADMPASWLSRLAVDNNGVLHIVWYYYPTGRFRHCTYRNGVFSTITQPVGGHSGTYVLATMMFDRNNMLHALVYRRTSVSYYSKLTYYQYENSLWSNPSIITDTVSQGDLAINFNNEPRCLWNLVLFEDGYTKYSKYEHETWATPTTITCGQMSDQRCIIVEKNGTEHVVQNEKHGESPNYVFKHMHYRYSEGEWSGNEIPDLGIGGYSNKLIFYDTTMYLVYFRRVATDSEDRSILLRKYTVPSQVGIVDFPAGQQFTIAPNPSNNRFTMDLGSENNGLCTIFIYSLQGRILLQKQDVLVGGRVVLETNELSNGIYLLSIETENKRMTEKIVITK